MDLRESVVEVWFDILEAILEKIRLRVLKRI